ncbi:MAG: (Fe-S)-binding protein [Thermodesulfobacteriota bacterium]|nr:(Fe-S)-binding protein [Thermodesulfobacteriota bacterium]
MLKVNLYFDEIDFYRYLPQTDCRECGLTTCKEFLGNLKRREIRLADCPHLSAHMIYAFDVALNAQQIIPEIELMQLPVIGKPGLVEFNIPDKHSPLLISGNSELTQLALSAILATTVKPFYVLFVDILGHTIDMAMIYGVLNEVRIRDAIEESHITDMIDHREIVIPGFAGSLHQEIERLTGLSVNVGPICCGELPLYFGEDWIPP